MIATAARGSPGYAFDEKLDRTRLTQMHVQTSDPEIFLQPGAITLPKGDWYVEPPVNGAYDINAQTDGARGQYISMTYPEGYQACVHIDDLGVVRCQLYRYNGAWPCDVDYANLRIRFRGVTSGT